MAKRYITIGGAANIYVYDDSVDPFAISTDGEIQGTVAPADILASLLTVDGSGSLLDADLLDGLHAAVFVLKAGDYIGGVTHHTNFEADGTMQAIGDATCWRDELSSLLGKKLTSPSAEIVENPIEGSLTFKASATTADYVTMSPQINHDWKVGSSVTPHIHWWQVSANVPNWLIQHRWQRNGEAKNTTWTGVAGVSSAFTYLSGVLNQITSFGDLTPPAGNNISDILQIRILRDTSNLSGLFAGADPEPSDIDALSIDVHIEIDMLGSRLIFTK